MKYRNKPEIKKDGYFRHSRHDTAEVASFHSDRMTSEKEIEIRNESPDKPAGNYEYEQLVAENASFNAKPMIEEAAFFLAEHRGFTPGGELSDWLQAETSVENLLRSTSEEDRRKAGVSDRRH